MTIHRERPAMELARRGARGGKAPAADGRLHRTIGALAEVRIRLAERPEDLMPGRFLAPMVARVLGAPPVTMRKDAGKRRVEAAQV